ncbi:MAG: hypothetical protein IJT36_03760 [Alphaproteobacteria bacterium]|nr:hypothetical protein [Alphaproteobacteria bacterium]
MINYNNPKKFEYEFCDFLLASSKKLTVNDILVYSVIFSESGEDRVFLGNIDFIAACTNLSRTTVFKSLKKMLEYGAIEKRTIEDGDKIYKGYVHSDFFLERYCIKNCDIETWNRSFQEDAAADFSEGSAE